MVNVRSLVHTMPMHQLSGKTGPMHQHHVTHSSTKLWTKVHTNSHIHTFHTHVPVGRCVDVALGAGHASLVAPQQLLPAGA